MYMYLFRRKKSISHNGICTLSLQQCYMWQVTAKGTLRPLLQVTGLVWIGSLFSHKHAAVFSSQEVQYDRMKAITQSLLIMLCTNKGSMVQAQSCFEWTSYGMARLFDFFVMRWPNSSCASLLSSSCIYHWLASNVCKPDTSGGRLQVPFAVTHHIYAVYYNLHLFDCDIGSQIFVFHFLIYCSPWLQSKPMFEWRSLCGKHRWHIIEMWLCYWLGRDKLWNW